MRSGTAPQCTGTGVRKGEYFQKPDIYLSSANALSETGEIVNIDGTGNRVSATLFGPSSASLCARQQAVPRSGKRGRARAQCRRAAERQAAGAKTPCAADGKCHDCKSPARICRAMAIHMGPPLGMEKCEVVLIGEALGY